MDTGAILATYGKYYDVLQVLGAFRLSDEPEISDLRISKALLQSAYREIRASKFGGSLVDYLCLVSTNYLGLISKANDCDEFAVFLTKDTENQKDVRNFLRFFVKRPEHLFELFKQTGNKRETFLVLSGMWFDQYFNQENLSGEPS